VVDTDIFSVIVLFSEQEDSQVDYLQARPNDWMPGELHNVGHDVLDSQLFAVPAMTT